MKKPSISTCERVLNPLTMILAPSLFVSCNKSSIQPQFDDLKPRDLYEDLKHQQILKDDAEFRLAWIAKPLAEGNRSPQLAKMLSEERAEHKANYEALSAITDKILAEKKYPEYQKLKAQEDEILA